ncbi:MAG: hypothetical protein WCG26_02090 [Chloroflexales bacterium]
MAVIKREIPSGAVNERQPTRQHGFDLSGLALSGVGFLFSLALWIVGARYTVDGVLAMTNALLDFLTIPAHIPIPSGWVLYLALAPIPVAYSLVEWHKVPLALADEGWRFAPAGQWVVWLVVYAIDTVTTWNGLGVGDRSAPLLVQQMTAALVGRAILTAGLTIGPEALLRSMAAAFRRALWKR